ncbi:MAG: hypothetical protein O2821_05595 [Chloroflexi bacterium]|nr:hypothetical protein [Chloroflexota bacterium]
MGSEIEIGMGIAKLKVSLAEFATVVRNLAGEAKHQDVRTTIKEMIDAVRVSYDTTVAVFTPLYALDSEQAFSDRFPQIRADFKAHYLTDTDAVRTRCHIVEAKLTDLLNRRGLLRSIPLVNRSFQRLDQLAMTWLSNDYELERDMNMFLQNINGLLDRLEFDMQSDLPDTYQDLRWSLSQFEDDLLATKRRLDDLDVISSVL